MPIVLSLDRFYGRILSISSRREQIVSNQHEYWKNL